MEIQKWEILRSHLAFNHPWCQVRQDQVQLPNGQTIDDYFITIRPEIALIVALTPQQELLLVRQYKHGAGEILLELPGGMIDPQETPETAARRELLEETGYTPTHLIKLTTLYDNPTKDTNHLHLFLAQNIIKTTQPQLDITEEIELVFIPFDQALSLISQGEICVAGSIAGILLALEYNKSQEHNN